MSINLQVSISVAKTDDSGQPTGDPLYSSKSPIMADTDCSIKVTIPGNATKWEVYVDAGKKDWLKFFALSPAPDANLSFYAADQTNATGEITLTQSIAYWGNALDQLFKGGDGAPDLTELKKLVFANGDGCPADVTIYYVRNVSKPKPAEPCPKKT